MDQAQDFKSLQDQIQDALITTTRTAGQISSEDLAFHRFLNPVVGTSLDEQSARLLALSNALLKSSASGFELRVPTLQEVDDVDSNWRNVIDVVDSLLEKADTCLDEYTGAIKRRDQPEQASTTKLKKNTSFLGSAFRTQNLLKPQLAFENKPNNDDNAPWKPLLTTKPHATVPLEDSLGTFTNDLQQQQYRHPYETEILHLKYPDSVYQTADPIPYLPVNTTLATFVDTPQGVVEMLDELKSASEIAVDLEHHDARSYVGLVSLMQISTRHKDWIIDTLKPWRQDLQVLNEVFADPNILKVFHGSFMDIIWLQRDLGIYVVGLFDTHWASKVLGYEGGSLAFLLKKFINFEADKKYQMADWRIRPIPDEMLFYARADTHYLLYIYDNMRNELIARSNREVPDENRIELVLEKSKETSLFRYERQVYNKESGKGPGGWYPLLAKSSARFNREQFAVFRAVHNWRDDIARKDDDSTAFVMPNHVMFNIAKLMPIDITALFGAAHSVSYSVKSRAEELLAVIRAAKASGKDGPSMEEVLRSYTAPKAEQASVREESTQSNVALVDESQLRSETSTFWGGAFGSSLWDSPSTIRRSDELRLAVPLPQLASDIFTTAKHQDLIDRSRMTVEDPTGHVSTLRPAITPRKEDDAAFVIKRGAKRKSDAISETENVTDRADETISEYDVSLYEEEEREALEKASRKAARRAEKKLEKAKRKLAVAEAASMESGVVEDEEPFDYTKAQPVLHGKRVDQVASKQQKPFDPYAKSADAPKGMRRLQTERPGKSFTFKG